MAWVRIPLLLCYTVNSFGCKKQFENNKQHTFNCIDYIGRMPEWSTALASGTSHFDFVGSDTTPVMLHCCKLTILLATKQFENNQQHTFNCTDYIGRMPEWSKALLSGTSHFDGVVSNPTPVMLHCYKLTVLTTKKQFENDKQHTFNCY